MLCVRLVEHRPAVGERQHVAVVESAHAREGAEVVIEGAVLLHQDDDVVDVRQLRRRHQLSECRTWQAERREAGARRGSAQQATPDEINHAHPLRFQDLRSRCRSCPMVVHPQIVAVRMR
jgi:hypothetical protein